MLPDTILRLKNLPQNEIERLLQEPFAVFSGEDDLARPGNDNLRAYGLLCEATGIEKEEDENVLMVKALKRICIVSRSWTRPLCEWTEAPAIDDLDDNQKTDGFLYQRTC